MNFIKQLQMRTGGGVEKSEKFADIINGCSPRHPSHFPTANKSQLRMRSRRRREDWIYSAIWEST